MTSRERVRLAINHKQPDRVPIDLGSTVVTGISASTYSKLRQELGLKHQSVKVIECYQMLGEVETEVRELLGIDTLPILRPNSRFGFKNDNWKPWRMFDGTDVLVPGAFNTVEDENGDILMYPGGDTTAEPSARMPKDGFYFDSIIRQQEIDEDNLDPKEWMDGFLSVISDEELKFIQEQTDLNYANTDYSLVFWYGSGGIGDIGSVPAPWIDKPKGIRDISMWYTAPLLYPDYVKGIFELQTNLVIQNLKLLKEALGDKIDVFGVSGTDFGAQNGPFISPEIYREFFKPFHIQMNNWIHENTNWKVMYHSCGSIIAFLDDFIEAGVDIINPVQCSAAGMDPQTLKDKWGDKLVFWGGAVDTQQVLPFGTVNDVQEQTKERVKIFGKDGGFVAAAIHNIQQSVPPENVAAFFETLRGSKRLFNKID